MKRILRRLCPLLRVLALCLTPASAMTVEEAIRLLNMHYVDELPAAVYEAETLEELFEALGDPYTYYMSAEQYEEFTDYVESETSVTGLGVGIEYTADGILIGSVLPGGGAEEAGLVPGDLIIAIGDTSCVPAAETHRALIVGEAGTYVDITVRHVDGTEQTYRIERRTIEIHNTTASCEDGVCVIRCNSFGTKTGDYFEESVETYDKDAELWIVDLRGNGGGITDSAVASLGIFSGEGDKLFYRTGEGNSYYTRYTLDAMTDKPVIVLVSGNTASSAELFAGGVRADSAGVIVGPRTYGKGTAQIIMDMTNHPGIFKDGSSFKITAYRFYCGDGDTTDKIGVLPTLFVSEQYTAGVASLLRAKKPEAEPYLTLRLNGITLYVSPEQAKADGLDDALGELLAALAPDASLTLTADGKTEEITSGAALARFGNERVKSRRFTDVADSPYADAIDTLGTYGVLNGVGDGRFDPERTLTRAELCAMLSQALNVSSTASGLFPDVPDGQWYTGCVNAAASLGFVNGRGDGFDPNGTLTQEQFIAIMGRLVRFLNFHADDYALALKEEDLSAEPYGALAPWARLEANVMNESSEGSLLYADLDSIDLQAPVTREQAAATLCKVFQMRKILAY